MLIRPPAFVDLQIPLPLTFFLPRLFDDKSCYGRSPQKYTMMVGLSPLINQEIHFWPLSYDGTEVLLQGSVRQEHGLLINWLV